MKKILWFIACIGLLCDCSNLKNIWSVDEILIDYAISPINIASEFPGISWTLSSPLKNQTQQSYSIQIATKKNLLQPGKVDVWNSGKVVSSQSSHIYPDVNLKSDTDYWIKVTSWDQKGRRGSKISTFSTALYSEEDWNSRWIGLNTDSVSGTEPDSLLENRSQYLRKEFYTKGKIKRARAFVCGLGFYELNINGRKVGDHVMAPAKTRYVDRVLYEVFDVKKYLNVRNNAIGIHLGNGWYSPNLKYRDWRMPFYGYPRAIFQLHIEYENGEKEKICSDDTWKTSYGPIVFNSIYDGECYDACLELSGWDKSGFNDSDWGSAVVMQSPGKRMQPHIIQPERVVETITPVKTYVKGQNKILYDMGQNFSGWSQIKVKGEKGAVITIHHAEKFNEADTSLNAKTNRAALNTDVYILKGEDIEVYEPRFAFHGFQYVEVSVSGKAEVVDVKGRVVHTDVSVISNLETDNELINRIHHCTMWSQRSNMHGLALDCPQRDERLGWVADGYVTSDEAMLNFDAALFYRKWLDDMFYAQDHLGRLPHIAPTFATREETNWSCGFILMLWDHYRNYGDMGIIQKYYPAVCSYIAYLVNVSDEYILPADRYGDWGTPAQDKDMREISGWVRGNPKSSTTAMFYYCTDIALKCARILKIDEDIQKYIRLKDSIQEAFNNTFFDETTSIYEGENYHYQYLQSIPLYFGLVPEISREKVMGNLLNDILVKKDGHIHAGIIGTKYMVDLLTENDRNDVVYIMLTAEGYPGWDYMTKGLTTFPEWWNREGSLNHVMFGSIDAWFYRSLAGIQTVEEKPGYEHFILKPYFPETGLNRIEASVKTIKGVISSSWKKDEYGITLIIKIPANTKATIKLPCNYQILIDNIPLDRNEHVYIEEIDKYLNFELGSGEYSIRLNI